MLENGGDANSKKTTRKTDWAAMILWVLLAFQRFSVFLLNILEMFRNPMIVQWHVRASSLQLTPFTPHTSCVCARGKHFSLSNSWAGGAKGSCQMLFVILRQCHG